MIDRLPAARRGVYVAERASALAGVPKSTVYAWAREGTLIPTVSSRRVKLWSWADLVGLRAIYWLRRPPTGERRHATSKRVVLELIEAIETEVGHLGEALGERAVLLSVDPGGVPHIEIGDVMREARHAWKQTVARSAVIDLLTEFSPGDGLVGPNLIAPGEGLRIVPGKLSGEPHIENTRIETRVIARLGARGFDDREIHQLYPQASLIAVRAAVALEQQLQRNLLAA